MIQSIYIKAITNAAGQDLLLRELGYQHTAR